MSSRSSRLPVPPPPVPAQDAFIQVPLGMLPPLTAEQAARLQALYEWAFQEAQAVVRPSILERDLLGVWN